MFFRFAFLFMLGSVGGWVVELLFRRFFSMKKWINPGFLNGPYLPMYGLGALLLYGACFIPLPRWGLALLLFAALTLLEYVTGLIFIKGMKIKLWDYSDRIGNIQGIICPLFSLLWGAVAALFVYLLFEPLHSAAIWSAESIGMIFAIGVFYGVFFVDLCISFNVSLKIQKAAQQIKTAVHYEELKAMLNERRAKNKQKRKFLFPFAGTSFADSVKEWAEKAKNTMKSAREKRKNKKENEKRDD